MILVGKEQVTSQFPYPPFFESEKEEDFSGVLSLKAARDHFVLVTARKVRT